MGQAAIPIALALASAGASAYNTAKTANKQDKILAQGIREQGELQQQANRRLNDTINYFEGSTPDEIKAQITSQMGRQLQLKRAQALAALQQPGGASEASQEAAQKAGLSAQDYAKTLAGLFGRIDAPVEQRRNEGFQRIDLGDDLSVTGRNSRALDYLTRLKASGVRRNPWLDILSAGLSGASTGVALGGGGGIAGSGTVGGSQLTPQQFYSASSAASLPGMTGQSGKLFSLFGP